MADVKIWVSGELLRISIDVHNYHRVAAYGVGVIRAEKHKPEGIVLTGNMLYEALKHLNDPDSHWKERVRDFLRRGDDVSAGKLWRAYTGLDLK